MFFKVQRLVVSKNGNRRRRRVLYYVFYDRFKCSLRSKVIIIYVHEQAKEREHEEPIQMCHMPKIIKTTINFESEELKTNGGTYDTI